MPSALTKRSMAYFVPRPAAHRSGADLEGSFLYAASVPVDTSRASAARRGYRAVGPHRFVSCRYESVRSVSTRRDAVVLTNMLEVGPINSPCVQIRLWHCSASQAQWWVPCRCNHAKKRPHARATRNRLCPCASLTPDATLHTAALWCTSRSVHKHVCYKDVIMCSRAWKMRDSQCPSDVPGGPSSSTAAPKKAGQSKKVRAKSVTSSVVTYVVFVSGSKCAKSFFEYFGKG
jgi:hypothetical protein